VLPLPGMQVFERRVGVPPLPDLLMPVRPQELGMATGVHFSVDQIIRPAIGRVVHDNEGGRDIELPPFVRLPPRIEGGRLEEPDFAPPEEIFQWTRGLEAAKSEPTELQVEFENGIPVGLNGERMAALELVQQANRIAGENGVGRVDIMEDRMLGLKVRENYECPGAVTLLTAHRALEALVLTAEELRFKKLVDQKWGEMAYAGLWFDPLKDDLEAFIGKTQERVTGTVNLRLYGGGLTVTGRRSAWALYNEDLASFDSKSFDQRESAGTVRTHGLQARMFRSLAEKHGKLGSPAAPGG
ncbi:MAG: hypothetical protein C4289_06730, partial [Chloroflexota bacterium]